MSRSLAQSRSLVILFVLSGAISSRPVSAQTSEDETLHTSDGVAVAVTYFPSSEKKRATPVVILHDYKENRAAYTSMARKLQSPAKNSDLASFAVLTVDLRGHGESTKQQLRGRPAIELDAANLRRNDFMNMAVIDMEAVRKFLITKNDAEEVNINKLCIIGVGLGANVATLYSARDWNAPVLAIGKQGQDVKGLVLVSPRWRNRGLLMREALRQPGVQREIALMMMYGADDRDVKADVLRIKKQVERYHPEPESTAGPPNDLVGLAVPNTSLQGGKLLSQVGDKAVKPIAEFLNLHVTKENHDWFQRRNRIQ